MCGGLVQSQESLMPMPRPSREASCYEDNLRTNDVAGLEFRSSEERDMRARMERHGFSRWIKEQREFLQRWAEKDQVKIVHFCGPNYHPSMAMGFLCRLRRLRQLLEREAAHPHLSV